MLVGLCVIKLNGADLACERSKRPNEEKKKKGKKKRKRKEGKKKKEDQMGFRSRIWEKESRTKVIVVAGKLVVAR